MMFELGNMSIGANDPEYQVDGDAGKPATRPTGMLHYFVNTIEERRQQSRRPI